MLAGNPCESQSSDCDSSAFAGATKNSFFQNSPPAPPSPPPPPPPPPQLPPPPLSMTGVRRKKILAAAAVPEKVRALRREFLIFGCLELELELELELVWGLGFSGEGEEVGEKRSHLMEEARGLKLALCFLREERMGVLGRRLLDAVKDMVFGEGEGGEKE